jgi:hypothetical protein
MQLTDTQAQLLLAQHSNSRCITAQDVAQLLGTVSTTFASIAYVTAVPTAAAHRSRKVQKVTAANVQLFSNIAAATSVFANAVKRTATALQQDPAAVAAYTAADNYFTHTACYSVVLHKTKAQHYLYAIYNNSRSLYYIDGAAATKQEVAALLTPSAASALLQPAATVHNATHNIDHTVRVRTIALQNIVSITAQKQQLTV